MSSSMRRRIFDVEVKLIQKMDQKVTLAPVSAPQAKKEVK